MKTVRITMPDIPFKGDLAYALANRDDAEKEWKEIQIGKMNYPKSSLKKTSLSAFMFQIAP